MDSLRARTLLTGAQRRAGSYRGDMTETQKPQLDKFKEAARDLECDDDERKFQERLAVIAKQKSKAAKPSA